MKKNYFYISETSFPETKTQKFKQFVKRTFKLELFVGLWIVFREMSKRNFHTVQYPEEKFILPPRYRALHKLLRLAQSGNERCIGCGLCEKICISKCIRMDTRLGDDGRKKVTQYTINFGRCIFCGFCAEVCPELAIVHGGEYENASEQRASFALKQDLLTPIDDFRMGKQKEFEGFGSLSVNADENIKKTLVKFEAKPCMRL